MTKKSVGRLKRDAFKNNNTAWDDLREIYLKNQSNLNALTASINAFFRVDNIALFIPAGQHEYTVGVIKGLASDVKNFQTRLNDIYGQHKDKTGKFEFDDAGYVRLISLGDEYVRFSHDYSTILDPLYKQALGIMSSIENRIAEVAAQAEPAAETETAAV